MKKLVLIVVGFVALFLAAGAINQLIQPEMALESNQPSSVAESSEVSEETEMETTLESSTTEETGEDSSVEQTSSPEESSIEETTAEIANIVTDFPNTQMRDAFGNTVNLHDKLDKPTIINVWASWCPPCREEMPYFQAQYEQHRDDINFIMLNAIGSRPTETVETANQFLREFNYTFPIFYDIDRNNQIRLGVMSLPSTYVIDSQGQAQRIMGMLTEDQLAQVIEDLLD